MSSATVLVSATVGESGGSSGCVDTDFTADDLAVEESSGGSGSNSIVSFPVEQDKCCSFHHKKPSCRIAKDAPEEPDTLSSEQCRTIMIL